MSGRTLAIGDIHGCNTALDTLLGQLRITAEDCVVVLGDIVDRGPGTRQVIERLIDLQQQCRFHYVMGNHEQMMLEALEITWEELKMRNWLRYGGREVIASYGGSIDQIPEEHLDFIRTAADYHETATDVFVHANLEPDIPLSEQNELWLRWSRYTGEEAPLESGKRVICGHSVQPGGLPVHSRGWVCIDTCAYCPEGWLTCLDVLTDEFFQADQRGRFRTGQL